MSLLLGLHEATVFVDPDTVATAPEGSTGTWTPTMTEEFNGVVESRRGVGEMVGFRRNGPAWRTRYPDYPLSADNQPFSANPALPEQQVYLPEGVTTSAGSLLLTATKFTADPSPWSGKRYSSGMICSPYSFTPTFGWFEARMKLPGGVCQWPAFWMFTADFAWEPTQPQVELDIMECFEQNATIAVTNHLPGRTVNMVSHNVGDVTQWHTYGMRWSATDVEWFVDGVSFAHETNAAAVPQVPMYPILNLATRPQASEAAYPASMVTEVDWVRCWAAA